MKDRAIQLYTIGVGASERLKLLDGLRMANIDTVRPGDLKRRRLMDMILEAQRRHREAIEAYNRLLAIEEKVRRTRSDFDKASAALLDLLVKTEKGMRWLLNVEPARGAGKRRKTR